MERPPNSFIGTKHTDALTMAETVALFAAYQRLFRGATPVSKHVGGRARDLKHAGQIREAKREHKQRRAAISKKDRQRNRRKFN